MGSFAPPNVIPLVVFTPFLVLIKFLRIDLIPMSLFYVLKMLLINHFNNFPLEDQWITKLHHFTNSSYQKI
jgi:hypothetical protein